MHYIFPPEHWGCAVGGTCTIGHYFEFHYTSSVSNASPSLQPTQNVISPPEQESSTEPPPAEPARPACLLEEPPLLTNRDEIMDVYSKLNQLLRAMKERSAGGGNKSGRYKKADTARRHFLQTRGLPGKHHCAPPRFPMHNVLYARLEIRKNSLQARHAHFVHASRCWWSRQGANPLTRALPWS